MSQNELSVLMLAPIISLMFSDWQRFEAQLHERFDYLPKPWIVAVDVRFGGMAGVFHPRIKVFKERHLVFSTWVGHEADAVLLPTRLTAE